MLCPQRIGDELWEIPVGAVPGMRVPARVFADAELLAAIEHDRSLEQLANVATLPGIVDAALAMPDIHQGYGFPVGGVAATDASSGVISPGGVGYDINCGVRLLALPIDYDDLGGRRERLVHELSRRVPVGTGGRGSREGIRGAEPRPRPVARPPRAAGGPRDRLRGGARASPSRRGGCRRRTRRRCRRAPASAASSRSERSARATTSSSCSASSGCTTSTPRGRLDCGRDS